MIKNKTNNKRFFVFAVVALILTFVITFCVSVVTTETAKAEGFDYDNIQNYTWVTSRAPMKNNEWKDKETYWEWEKRFKTGNDWIPEVLAAFQDPYTEYAMQQMWARGMSNFAGATYQGYHTASSYIEGTNPLSSPFAVAASVARLSYYVTGTVEVDDESGETVLVLAENKDGDVLWISSAMRAAYNATKVVGISLATLYFIMGLLSSIQMESLSSDILIKKLISFTVVIVVIIYGFEIFSTIAELGDSMLTAAQKWSTIATKANVSNAACLNRIYAIEVASSGIQAVLMFFYTGLDVFLHLVPIITSLIMILAVFIYMFSRVVEIYVRFMFAPIGLATLVSGGEHSAGVKYIKKFASVVLQGAIIVIIALSTTLINSTITSGFGSVLANFTGIPGLIMNITAIGAMTRCGRIADDIMGV